jgi:hypothetical protein
MFFTEILKNPKIHTKIPKTPKSQSNFEPKEQSQRHHNTRIQGVLQSHSNQDSMKLA